MSKKIKILNFKWFSGIGFAYWEDQYNRNTSGLDGFTRNLLILFIRVSWGFVLIDSE